MTQPREHSATAVLATAPNVVSLGQVELADLGPGDVLIRTMATSISAGTERQMLAGTIAMPGGSPFPYIPGYEAVGVVEAVGAEVQAGLLGQHMFVGGSMGYKGVKAFFGAQSSAIVAPAARVIPLGDLDVRLGLLIGLAATALHGLARIGPLAGKSLLVCGQGAVGRLATIAARHQGAAWIAVSDMHPGRLSGAPADEVLLAVPGGSPEPLGRKVDVLIEASGNAQALVPFLPSLVRDGTILLLGLYERFSLPYLPLFFAEPTLVVSREWGAGDPEAALALLGATREQAGALLTHDFACADAAAAFAAAIGDPACHKAVLHWGDGPRR